MFFLFIVCLLSLQIRFDLPTTLLAFIQSRGRARVLASHMVLMLEAGNNAQAQLVTEVKMCAIEQDLLHLSAPHSSQHNTLQLLAGNDLLVCMAKVGSSRVCSECIMCSMSRRAQVRGEDASRGAAAAPGRAC